jgi:hypothetical protein
MTDTQIIAWTQQLGTLMAERLRIKGRDFEHQVDKAGRLLPARVRREAHYLVETARLTTNPKLRRMIDHDKARKAHEVVAAHLLAIDPKEIARTRLLRRLAKIALFVLVLGAAAVWYLASRGLV